MPDKLLPALLTRVRVDDSDLKRAAASSHSLGSSIKTSLDQQATPATQRLTAATKGHIAALQTATSFTTNYGGALTKQEANYARLQLTQLGVTTGERDLAKEGASAARALGSMGAQGAATIERFSSLAGTMGSAGPLGIAIGAATVGFGLLVAGIEDGESKYLALADTVEKYAAVSGESAQQASRQVIALQELGVSADTAQSGFFRLGKVVAEHPEKLQQMGIAIARTKDGQVDLDGTLMNAIDVYNRTGDAAARSAILFQAFGRAGQDMLPVFVAGTARLKQLEDQVNLVFTDQNLQDARKYGIEQKILSEQLNELQMGFGNFATGPQRAATEEFLANAYASQKVDAALGHVQGSMGVRGQGVRDLTKKYHDQYIASLNSQVAADGLSSALEGQAKAADDAEKSARDLYTSMLDADQAQLSFTKSTEQVAGLADDYTKKQISLSRAQFDVTDKTQALKDAVAKYGGKSEEAKKATLDLRDAQLQLKSATRDLQGSLNDQEGTVLGNALAYVDLQDKLAKAKGETVNTADDQQNLVAGLENVRKELDPSNPLYKNLTAYIDQLEQGIPPKVTTTIDIKFAPGSGGVLKQAVDAVGVLGGAKTGTDFTVVGRTSGGRQFGGPVQPNRDYIVGERGPEVLRMGAAGGYVYPNGATPPAAPAAAAPVSITQNFNAAGMSAWDVGREMAWLMKSGLR